MAGTRAAIRYAKAILDIANSKGVAQAVNKDMTTIGSTIKENLEIANGDSAIFNTMREGLVLRNYRQGVSFKIVSPLFLLKHDE